jgi:hypothetical protein
LEEGALPILAIDFQTDGEVMAKQGLILIVLRRPTDGFFRRPNFMGTGLKPGANETALANL